MAKQTINIGAAPNDGTGTPLRTSFDYCNQNFTELYTATGPSGNNIVVPGSATITGDLTVDTSTLKVDSANNRVGIGTASPANPFDVVSASGTIALFKRTGSNSAFIGIQDGSGSLSYLGSTNGAFSIQTPGSGYSDKYTIASDGVATWSNVGGVAGTAMTLNSTGLAIGGSAFSISRLTLVSSASNDCLFSLQKSGTARTAVVKTDGTNLYLSSDSGATGNKISLSLTAPDSSLSIDSSGNVGVGVTPSAWNSAVPAIQVKGVSGIYGAGSSEFGMTQNNFYNASGQWIYGTTAAAGRYSISAGVHAWYTVGSGTAGTQITWTQAMTLDASGNLLVGTTTGSFRGQFAVASGADRNIFTAQVTGASNGFQILWNHATTTTRVIIANIPTSSAGLAAGTLWNDAGTIKIA